MGSESEPGSVNVNKPWEKLILQLRDFNLDYDNRKHLTIKEATEGWWEVMTLHSSHSVYLKTNSINQYGKCVNKRAMIIVGASPLIPRSWICMSPKRLLATKVMAAHCSAPCQGEGRISSRPLPECSAPKGHNFSFVTHGGGRARHSDWYENSFIMVVYENFF